MSLLCNLMYVCKHDCATNNRYYDVGKFVIRSVNWLSSAKGPISQLSYWFEKRYSQCDVDPKQPSHSLFPSPYLSPVERGFPSHRPRTVAACSLSSTCDNLIGSSPWELVCGPEPGRYNSWNKCCQDYRDHEDLREGDRKGGGGGE